MPHLFNKIIMTAASLVCFAATASAADVKVSQRTTATLHVVAVGVQSYADPFWHVLKWPEKDVDSFSSELARDSAQTVRVHKILGKDASLAGVKRLLQDVAKQASPKDEVIVYFSTHGSLILNQGVLEPTTILYDTRQSDLAGTSLRNESLRRLVDAIPARKKAVVMATCHSGIGKSQLTSEVQQFLASQKGKPALIDSADSGVLFLTAAAQGEPAREDDKLKGDIYTHYFLEGLTLGDRNKDGAVSVMEAHDYARAKTIDATGGMQRPTLEARFVGAGDFNIRGRPTTDGLPVLSGYDERFSQLAMEVNGRSKSALPSAAAMRPGSNEVALFDASGNELARYRVEGNAGELIDLEDVIKPPPYVLGLGLRYIRAESESWQRLIGGRSFYSPEIRIGWMPTVGASLFDIGATYSQWRNKVNGYASGIDASSRAADVGLNVGVSRALGFSQIATFALGIRRHELMVDFAEADGGEVISTRAVGYGFGVTGKWQTNLQNNFGGYLEAGRYWSKLNFGEQGSIGMNRFELSIGVLKLSGSKGVRQ